MISRWRFGGGGGGSGGLYAYVMLFDKMKALILLKLSGVKPAEVWVEKKKIISVHSLSPLCFSADAALNGKFSAFDFLNLALRV